MNKKSAVTLIIIMLLLSILFVLQLPKLRFNYVFEDFFPTDDPEINTYQEFVEIFEQDNDYLLIALKGKKGIFNEHYIHNLQQLTSRINAVEGVATTHSLLTVEQPIISPAGLFSVP